MRQKKTSSTYTTMSREKSLWISVQAFVDSFRKSKKFKTSLVIEFHNQYGGVETAGFEVKFDKKEVINLALIAIRRLRVKYRRNIEKEEKLLRNEKRILEEM